MLIGIIEQEKTRIPGNGRDNVVRRTAVRAFGYGTDARGRGGVSNEKQDERGEAQGGKKLEEQHRGATFAMEGRER